MESISYDEWLLKYQPIWSSYTCRPSLRITELTCLALGIDPSIGKLLVTDEYRSYVTDRIKQRQRFSNYPSLIKKILLRKGPRHEHLEHELEFIENYNWICFLASEHKKELGGALDFIEGTDRLNIFKFADWAIDNQISLVPDFPRKNRIKEDHIKEDAELSKGEKKSLTGRNNTLVRMVGELVELHFPPRTSAGEIAKEISASDTTVRSILKQYREK